jgi:hypothetical protein
MAPDAAPDGAAAKGDQVLATAETRALATIRSVFWNATQRTALSSLAIYGKPVPVHLPLPAPVPVHPAIYPQLFDIPVDASGRPLRPLLPRPPVYAFPPPSVVMSGGGTSVLLAFKPTAAPRLAIEEGAEEAKPAEGAEPTPADLFPPSLASPAAASVLLRAVAAGSELWLRLALDYADGDAATEPPGAASEEDPFTVPAAGRSCRAQLRLRVAQTVLARFMIAAWSLGAPLLLPANTNCEIQAGAQSVVPMPAPAAAAAAAGSVAPAAAAATAGTAPSGTAAPSSPAPKSVADATAPSTSPYFNLGPVFSGFAGSGVGRRTALVATLRASVVRAAALAALAPSAALAAAGTESIVFCDDAYATRWVAILETWGGRFSRFRRRSADEEPSDADDEPAAGTDDEEDTVPAVLVPVVWDAASATPYSPSLRAAGGAIFHRVHVVPFSVLRRAEATSEADTEDAGASNGPESIFVFPSTVAQLVRTALAVIPDLRGMSMFDSEPSAAFETFDAAPSAGTHCLKNPLSAEDAMGAAPAVCRKVPRMENASASFLHALAPLLASSPAAGTATAPKFALLPDDSSTGGVEPVYSAAGTGLLPFGLPFAAFNSGSGALATGKQIAHLSSQLSTASLLSGVLLCAMPKLAASLTPALLGQPEEGPAGELAALVSVPRQEGPSVLGRIVQWTRSSAAALGMPVPLLELRKLVSASAEMKAEVPIDGLKPEVFGAATPDAMAMDGAVPSVVAVGETVAAPAGPEAVSVETEPLPLARAFMGLLLAQSNVGLVISVLSRCLCIFAAPLPDRPLLSFTAHPAVMAVASQSPAMNPALNPQAQVATLLPSAWTAAAGCALVPRCDRRVLAVATPAQVREQARIVYFLGHTANPPAAYAAYGPPSVYAAFGGQGRPQGRPGKYPCPVPTTLFLAGIDPGAGLQPTVVRLRRSLFLTLSQIDGIQLMHLQGKELAVATGIVPRSATQGLGIKVPVRQPAPTSVFGWQTRRALTTAFAADAQSKSGASAKSKGGARRCENMSDEHEQELLIGRVPISVLVPAEESTRRNGLIARKATLSAPTTPLSGASASSSSDTAALLRFLVSLHASAQHGKMGALAAAASADAEVDAFRALDGDSTETDIVASLSDEVRLLLRGTGVLSSPISTYPLPLLLHVLGFAREAPAAGRALTVETLWAPLSNRASLYGSRLLALDDALSLVAHTSVSTSSMAAGAASGGRGAKSAAAAAAKAVPTTLRKAVDLRCVAPTPRSFLPQCANLSAALLAESEQDAHSVLGSALHCGAYRRSGVVKIGDIRLSPCNPLSMTSQQRDQQASRSPALFQVSFSSLARIGKRVRAAVDSVYPVSTVSDDLLRPFRDLSEPVSLFCAATAAQAGFGTLRDQPGLRPACLQAERECIVEVAGLSQAATPARPCIDAAYMARVSSKAAAVRSLLVEASHLGYTVGLGGLHGQNSRATQNGKRIVFLTHTEVTAATVRYTAARSRLGLCEVDFGSIEPEFEAVTTPAAAAAGVDKKTASTKKAAAKAGKGTATSAAKTAVPSVASPPGDEPRDKPTGSAETTSAASAGLLNLRAPMWLVDMVARDLTIAVAGGAYGIVSTAAGAETAYGSACPPLSMPSVRRVVNAALSAVEALVASVPLLDVLFTDTATAGPVSFVLVDTPIAPPSLSGFAALVAGAVSAANANAKQQPQPKTAKPTLPPTLPVTMDLVKVIINNWLSGALLKRVLQRSALARGEAGSSFVTASTTSATQNLTSAMPLQKIEAGAGSPSLSLLRLVCATSIEQLLIMMGLSSSGTPLGVGSGAAGPGSMSLLPSTVAQVFATASLCKAAGNTTATDDSGHSASSAVATGPMAEIFACVGGDTGNHINYHSSAMDEIDGVCDGSTASVECVSLMLISFAAAAGLTGAQTYGVLPQADVLAALPSLLPAGSQRNGGASGSLRAALRRLHAQQSGVRLRGFLVGNRVAEDSYEAAADSDALDADAESVADGGELCVLEPSFVPLPKHKLTAGRLRSYKLPSALVAVATAKARARGLGRFRLAASLLRDASSRLAAALREKDPFPQTRLTLAASLLAGTISSTSCEDPTSVALAKALTGTLHDSDSPNGLGDGYSGVNGIQAEQVLGSLRLGPSPWGRVLSCSVYESAYGLDEDEADRAKAAFASVQQAGGITRRRPEVGGLYKRSRNLIGATLAGMDVIARHQDAGGYHFSHAYGPPHTDRRQPSAPPLNKSDPSAGAQARATAQTLEYLVAQSQILPPTRLLREDRRETLAKGHKVRARATWSEDPEGDSTVLSLAANLFSRIHSTSIQQPLSLRLQTPAAHAIAAHASSLAQAQTFVTMLAPDPAIDLPSHAGLLLQSRADHGEGIFSFNPRPPVMPVRSAYPLLAWSSAGTLNTAIPRSEVPKIPAQTTGIVFGPAPCLTASYVSDEVVLHAFQTGEKDYKNAQKGYKKHKSVAAAVAAAAQSAAANPATDEVKMETDATGTEPGLAVASAATPVPVVPPTNASAAAENAEGEEPEILPLPDVHFDYQGCTTPARTAVIVALIKALRDRARAALVRSHMVLLAKCFGFVHASATDDDAMAALDAAAAPAAAAAPEVKQPAEESTPIPPPAVVVASAADPAVPAGDVAGTKRPREEDTNAEAAPGEGAPPAKVPRLDPSAPVAVAATATVEESPRQIIQRAADALADRPKWIDTFQRILQLDQSVARVAVARAVTLLTGRKVHGPLFSTFAGPEDAQSPTAGGSSAAHAEVGSVPSDGFAAAVFPPPRGSSLNAVASMTADFDFETSRTWMGFGYNSYNNKATINAKELPWSPAEDLLLLRTVSRHGTNWDLVYHTFRAAAVRLPIPVIAANSGPYSGVLRCGPTAAIATAARYRPLRTTRQLYQRFLHISTRSLHVYSQLSSDGSMHNVVMPFQGDANDREREEHNRRLVRLPITSVPAQIGTLRRQPKRTQHIIGTAGLCRVAPQTFSGADELELPVIPTVQSSDAAAATREVVALSVSRCLPQASTRIKSLRNTGQLLNRFLPLRIRPTYLPAKAADQALDAPHASYVDALRRAQPIPEDALKGGLMPLAAAAPSTPASAFTVSERASSITPSVMPSLPPSVLAGAANISSYKREALPFPVTVSALATPYTYAAEPLRKLGSYVQGIFGRELARRREKEKEKEKENAERERRLAQQKAMHLQKQHDAQVEAIIERIMKDNHMKVLQETTNIDVTGLLRAILYEPATVTLVKETSAKIARGEQTQEQADGLIIGALLNRLNETGGK